MSMWFLMAVVTAGGAALLVWHMVTETKSQTEQMLTTYKDMLAQAREDRIRSLQKAAEQSEEDAANSASAEPTIAEGETIVSG